MGKIVSKSYGENDYKGFILLQDRKTKKITRHYISAVDGDYLDKNKVHLWLRGKNGDICMDYKMGSNKKADIGIKTWVKERHKKNKRIHDRLPDSCWSFVKR